jgi:hypothetical protein
MKVIEGSRWKGASDNVFRVIHVVKIDDHTWIHYRRDDIECDREYSCYIESFVSRFTPILNESRK